MKMDTISSPVHPLSIRVTEDYYILRVITKIVTTTRLFGRRKRLIIRQATQLYYPNIVRTVTYYKELRIRKIIFKVPNIEVVSSFHYNITSLRVCPC